MSPGTFAAFSKFHLNTSNSPNAKVVCFVEEHNFHVEWHLRFVVEMREKAWSALVVTIHRCPENSNLGMQFVQKRWRKGPYALCKSCRGSRDLQLWYSNVCPLQFNFFEKNSVKLCQSKLFLAPGALERVGRAAAGPAHRGWPLPAGPCAVGPPAPHRHPCPISLPHVSHVHRPRRADRRRSPNDVTAVRRCTLPPLCAHATPLPRRGS
jgi:hypothetical protein